MKRFLVSCLTCFLALQSIIALVAPSITLAWLSFEFDFRINVGHLILCVVASGFLFTWASLAMERFELMLHREHPEWWTK